MALGPAVSNTENYLSLVSKYYDQNLSTTVVQIEAVLLIFKMTNDQKAFKILFLTHRYLLNKILKESFNKYKKHLYAEDFYELESMISEEFYRRILFCKMPTVAPFHAYIKLYMSKWANTYAKLIVKKNDGLILDCDRLIPRMINND